MKSYLLISAICLFIPLAHGEEEGKSKDRIGPGKAVVASNEKEGFQLSEKAQKSLSLTFLKVNSTNIAVPTSALISFQDFLAIYRFRNGWFRLVEIEPKIHGEVATFSSKDLKSTDQIVVGNGGLLRVVELDVFGPEADACAD